MRRVTCLCSISLLLSHKQLQSKEKELYMYVSIYLPTYLPACFCIYLSIYLSSNRGKIYALYNLSCNTVISQSISLPSEVGALTKQIIPSLFLKLFCMWFQTDFKLSHSACLCNPQNPGHYTPLPTNAMEGFLADYILPDYLHCQETEVGTHSMKFICPGMNVSFIMRWLLSERLKVVHGRSTRGQIQMNITLDLISCNDGALTLENGLYQLFAGDLVTALVKCKEKCCPFCLGGREGRKEIFLGRWKIWKMK